MATLTLTVGSITATKTATNAKANEILSLFIESQGGPMDGTSQEKLDFVLNELANYLRGNARRMRILQDIRIAEGTANTTAELIDWS